MELEKQLQSKETRELARAILRLRNEEEALMFFRDLFTLEELADASRRWAVARMLEKKMTFDEIERKTGMSSATIARVNYWIHHGMGGYKLMLKRCS
ncbi:hypothetical protein A3A21_03785 [Candidatus Jorgensenbacteria bacterium RIFCSPLOWO2_01_FULL_45_25b]|uniref:TrpR, YerC/YecD n=1 Tax=Candidatus Jorgensenbacteria bacterium RIFCSPLOWO2_01_FULL_45_25b TaxID=1798471 RepID=A0A1F6BXR3_9BACT|nr:MAG: hypothetical protein A3A21_03785 [Candidatus Jorgensenbacteria bacterium RIFCSPLOWO2_01_FULL_45_25b]